MDDFLKKLFIEYMLKCEDKIYYGESQVKKLISFIIKEFALKNKLEYYKYTWDDTEDNFYEKVEVFKQDLHTILEKQKRILKYKKSILYKKSQIFSKIYHLTEDEYNIFVYFYVFKHYRYHQFFLNAITTNNNCYDYYGMTKNIFDYNEYVDKKIKKNLLEKGLISFESFYKDYVTNDFIEIIFTNKIDFNKKTLLKTLLGDSKKTNLGKKDFLYLKNELKVSVNLISKALQENKKGINILLYGKVGTGKTEFAKLIAKTCKINIYPVLNTNNGTELNRKGRLSDLYSKQHILCWYKNSCILFDEAEDVMNRSNSEIGYLSKAYLNTLLESTPVPVIWTTNNIYDIDPAFLRRMTFTVEFEKLTDNIRLGIWKRTLQKNNLKVDNKKLIELNETYDVPASMITNAISNTKLINRNQNDFEFFIENIAKVVNKKKNIKKIKNYEIKNYDLSIINTNIDIKHLTSQIKKSEKLNFSLCLFGEPGTGKSLYARYLANELGLEVIFKRASDLVSSWVGETEKNIASAFTEAKEKRAILIFDEADSFLRNRNNAYRSWEITQVNEMLTWMESHEYPFICTTNLLDSLDEASLRRFTFKIKFDFLNEKQLPFAMEYFFGIKNCNINIRGLTTGDFATVKKKIEFLGDTDLNSLIKMLKEEVELKKTESLKNNIGF